MSLFPDFNHVDRAYCRTVDSLGMTANASLNQNEVGVFLKYLLLEGLEQDEINDWRVRRSTDSCLALIRRLESLLIDIEATKKELKSVLGIEWDTFCLVCLATPLYRHRIIELAMEAVLSEPLSPETIIKPSYPPQHELSTALQGDWNHAIIFSSALFFSHDFYPLAVDAFVHDSKNFGRPRINVLGVNKDWLNENGTLKRIIYLDFTMGRLIETDLEIPIRPDSVQFLCLGDQEISRHAALSQRFKCKQVNPLAVSKLADNKAATLSGWSALGLTIPAYKQVMAGELNTALRFLDSVEEIVIKPNQATEGKFVDFFRRDQAQSKIELERHLNNCWELGSTLVQQRCDSVIFRNPATGTTHSLALRLNLAYDGERFCLESGYAQLGVNEHYSAACGRGGHIVSINEVLSGLISRYDTKGKSIELSEKDWARIREQSEQAAGLFPGLLLIGLDVLLDHDANGNIIPVFLEANPRPAGLSHSRLLTEDIMSSTQNGVSLKLWSGLAKFCL